MKTTLYVLLIFLGLMGCSSNISTISNSTSKVSSEEIYQLGLKHYSKHDYKEAIRLFQKAADDGNYKAQNDLGVIYYEGLGVTKNYKKALELFIKSESFFKSGTPQFNIAQIYHHGYGVKKDYAEARKWYLKSANQGYAAAQYNLGVIYQDGIGVSKNYKEALNWYGKATMQNHAGAWNNMGFMIENGQGVPKDKGLAFDFYLKGAQLGDAVSQFNVGNTYLNKSNNDKAKFWLQKSANQNYIPAIKKLATIRG